MRQKHETTTSFKELKEITQIMLQAQKRSALTPKARAHAKKGALKPTKRAFSERQITTIRDNSQASSDKSQEIEQANQQGDNANAFKSDEAFKQGLLTQQRGQE
ncbi:hypothetical protein [Helicobacter pylori]|uniref:hypothetical protein n=1 Tax=Helicobacter pylori TaxID=210 RepID=UPI000664EBD1|nr:hypothetical protein [Helicobacter pylori]KMT68716.1 hypothetical protein AB991_03800 [Helicobacter pylori]